MRAHTLSENGTQNIVASKCHVLWLYAIWRLLLLFFSVSCFLCARRSSRCIEVDLDTHKLATVATINTWRCERRHRMSFARNHANRIDERKKSRHRQHSLNCLRKSNFTNSGSTLLLIYLYIQLCLCTHTHAYLYIVYILKPIKCNRMRALAAIEGMSVEEKKNNTLLALITIHTHSKNHR